MRLKIADFFFIVFIHGCGTVMPPQDFGNMSYTVGEESYYQTVTLADGYYGDGLKYVYYDGDFVCGDFNRDGLGDAAVVITESGGGSGGSLILAFLINDGRQLAHRSSYYLDQADQIISLKESKGKIVVTMFVVNEEDYARHPVKRAKKIYEYRGPDNWSEALIENPVFGVSATR